MKISVNGEAREVEGETLAAVIEEVGLADAVIATGVNGEFVSASARAATRLNEGDAVELLAPMQGG
jgi:sulfur carrier protein